MYLLVKCHCDDEWIFPAEVCVIELDNGFLATLLKTQNAFDAAKAQFSSIEMVSVPYYADGFYSPLWEHTDELMDYLSEYEYKFVDEIPEGLVEDTNASYDYHRLQTSGGLFWLEYFMDEKVLCYTAEVETESIWEKLPDLVSE